MRRYLKPTIVLAVLGFVLGGLYRHLFVRAVEQMAVEPAEHEAEFVNYLRSSLHGMGITLAGWSVQLYFTSRSSAWVRRWPLAVELLVRSVAMALVVAAATIFLETVIYPHGIESHWLVSDFPFIVAIA